MKTIQTDKYAVHVGDDSLDELDRFLSSGSYSAIVILVDEHTKKDCLPVLKRSFSDARIISVIQLKSGEKNKNIRSCEKIWKALSKQYADRKALVLNLGGGVICDLGGFAASTYKRGIDFVNIPTTLLAQADASVGGKTGIDLDGLKNQVGTFTFPKAVFIDPRFLKTLSKRELIAGFAEVIKHGLIADKDHWADLQSLSAAHLAKGDHTDLIYRSIQIKNKIVSQDPTEQGIRKTLNFGHTIGHALESASLRSTKKLLHGEAVAMGMICEGYLSRKCCGLSNTELNSITDLIISWFSPGPVKIPARKLIGLMKQDKKNKDSEINFTLLSSIGKAEINNSCSEELIEEAIHFLNASCQ